MQVSKLSSKGQVTLPAKVRKLLGVGAGDFVSYEVDGNQVKLARVEPFDVAFHAALSSTLDEWTSDEDEEAFRDL